VQSEAETCFFERDPDVALARRAAVEAIGTLLLAFAVCGAGLASHHLFPERSSLGLMVSALATAGALIGLIVAFGSVSGGHFNPLISGLQWLAGERKLDCAVAYVLAQFGGGIAGALLARTIVDAGRPFVNPPPLTWPLAASEVLATAGLMIVVFGCARSRRTETGPFAVGAWLVGAIIATPSTSYANPAIALRALFAVGPVALPATTVIAYVPAELAGAVLAFVVITVAYPPHHEDGRTTARPTMAATEPLP
jgi:glycerol uptake facilitator-like aquaporin